jgi:hypothetical protein
MIRDPSDGSVREVSTSPPEGEVKPRSRPDTGLRQPTRTDAQERMERSRAWLKDYHEKRNARGEHDDSTATPEG